ncbi:MAG TPA: cache domain-containing protein [Steroidobacteraceae bacterium]|nr:cache domain-containing protein [Steroidobacteraceae bacterium]
MLNLRDRLYVCVGVMLLALMPMVGNSADGAPTKEEVVAQVKKAVAFYKANGREKTLAEMNNKDGQFAKGEDYIDVHDIHGVCQAHPISPGVVGLNRMDAADPAGKKWIREIVEETRAGKTSGWSTYQRKNPVSGKIEHKLAYWELSDDLIFKAGTYE